MARLPYVEPGSSAEVDDLYAEIDRLGRPVLNLYQVLANQPPALAAFLEMSRYVRSASSLDPRLRELTILVTARELDSQFEWAAHEAEALREGLAAETIETIRHRRGTGGLDEADAVVIEFGREIFTARKVSSASFARALALFGRRKLIDLVGLMGNYAATAAMLTAFDMQLDPDQPPPLPVQERL